MGDGTAWGGRLPCKQKFRSVQIRYPPPAPSNVRICFVQSRQVGVVKSTAVLGRTSIYTEVFGKLSRKYTTYLIGRTKFPVINRYVVS